MMMMMVMMMNSTLTMTKQKFSAIRNANEFVLMIFSFYSFFSHTSHCSFVLSLKTNIIYPQNIQFFM